MDRTPVSGQSSEAIQNQYLNWQILTNTHCRDLDTNKYIMNRLVCIQYKLYVLHLFWTANLDRYLLIVLAQIDLDVFESYWFHAGCVAGSPPLDALAADAAAPAAGCSSSLLPRPDIDTLFLVHALLCGSSVFGRVGMDVRFPSLSKFLPGTVGFVEVRYIIVKLCSSCHGNLGLEKCFSPI